MRATVVIPTLDARELLLETLASLERQTLRPEVVVVDNASSDGTAEAVAGRFPAVRLVRLERNVGFGRAVNRGVEEAGEPDTIVLVNNDVVCEPELVERLCAALGEDGVGMAAGVLLQADRPRLVDSAGIELDPTLRSWDLGWNKPVERLEDAADPVGPCGGAAAYRADAFRAAGGFDEQLFAYWEDVDLALRLRAEGWRCVLVRDARGLHRHGATLGAASPAQRRLEAFGRAYVLAKYRVARTGLLRRAMVAALDWPVLAVHLLVRRELGPLRERWRGTRAGLAQPPRHAPVELATVSFGQALGRQVALLRLRASGGLPAHFTDGGRAPRAGS